MDSSEANGNKKKGVERPRKDKKQTVGKPQNSKEEAPAVRPERNDRKKKEEPKKEEPKSHGPIINIKKEMNTSPQWSKGNALSFADMVRQKNAEKKKPEAAPVAPEPVSEEEDVIVQTAPAPVEEPVAPTPAEVASETPVVQAAPVVPEVPAAPAANFYVLEVDQVDSVTLPSNITHTSPDILSKYAFTAQPGVPPQTAAPQTLFRNDVANFPLASRSWGSIPSQQWGTGEWAPAVGGSGRPFNPPSQQYGNTFVQPNNRNATSQFRQTQLPLQNNRGVGGGVW